MAWFSIGFIAWIVDQNLCDYLTLFPYLHCFWHIFICLGKVNTQNQGFVVSKDNVFLKKYIFRGLFVNSLLCLFLCRIWSSRNRTTNWFLAFRRWQIRACWNSVCWTERNKKVSIKILRRILNNEVHTDPLNLNLTVFCKSVSNKYSI